MTATDSTRPRASRKRWVPIAATITAAALTAGAIATAGGGAAGAATKPQAQSVGNFLDATLGGNTLDAIAKLKYAQAKAPGSDGVQNPLDVTALNALNLPLTGDLQLPKLLGIDLGAVNQVAKADTDGSSYGASGAVQNSGGVSVGGNNNAYPANATIDLTASGIAGNTGLPIPGGGTADALGGVTATIGGVSALASTPKGYGKAGKTTYQIANIDLSIGSPLLGGLLTNLATPLTSALSTLLGTLTGLVNAVSNGALSQCDLTSVTALTQKISLEGGAITIEPTSAKITVSLDKLLTQLGLDLNKLPANTDLISYLLAYLTDPNGLAKGLTNLVNGLLDPLEQKFDDCATLLKAVPVLGDALYSVVHDFLIGTVQPQLESTIGDLVSLIAGAAGTNPLAPLGSILEKLIDIGVNVQPNGKAGPSGAAYIDPLAATPKQGTPVVAGQTVVRAIEVNVAGGAGATLPGLGTLPVLNSAREKSLTGGVHQAAAVRPLAAAPGSGTGILTLALANAAAGPSAAPAAATTTPPGGSTATVPATNVPTGVPAGAGKTGGGTPLLPLGLLLLGLMFAGGGAVAFRMRGRLNQH